MTLLFYLTQASSLFCNYFTGISPSFYRYFSLLFLHHSTVASLQIFSFFSIFILSGASFLLNLHQVLTVIILIFPFLLFWYGFIYVFYTVIWVLLFWYGFIYDIVGWREHFCIFVWKSFCCIYKIRNPNFSWICLDWLQENLMGYWNFKLELASEIKNSTPFYNVSGSLPTSLSTRGE